MKAYLLPFAVVGLFFAALLGVVLWPQLDLVVSEWFYRRGEGFFLSEWPGFVFLHWVALKGAWFLGYLFILMLLIAPIRALRIGGWRSFDWLFLLLALLLGPVLIANGVLKDNWGRARPREVVEFGGTSSFSYALVPQPDAHRNGSFISGDGAFGFYLPIFAYLVPLDTQRKASRRVFWGCITAGSAFGLARIAMGGHFFSDVLFAALLMLALSAALHVAMYGQKKTVEYWRAWMRFKNS
jgi:lipid A 4'-phosphatase